METLNQFAMKVHEHSKIGIFDGTFKTESYFLSCRHIFIPMMLSVIYTRDVGHHSCGWFKNPDYEQCLHLSLSFKDGFTKKKGEKVAKAFFKNHLHKVWIEPPYSPRGKHYEVYHYRLFCDPHWNPILPKKEVYSPLMPSTWKSFSELHGIKKLK